MLLVFIAAINLGFAEILQFLMYRVAQFKYNNKQFAIFNGVNFC